MPSRRQFLAHSLGASAALSLPRVAAADPAPTGLPVSELASFDEQILAYMQKERLPGGAVAVVHERRLVLARGYGLADREANLPVQPDSLFRIASVSKPITGLATLAALEDRLGGLSLQTRVFPYLGWEPFLPAGQTPDPRLNEITVEQLLHHTGGWDRDRSGDLMFRHFQAAQALGIPSPPDHKSLIRWALGQKLDTDPGTRYAYSNFGYCVLGRVLEKATGKTYEEFVRSRVLKPVGVTAMRIGSGRRREKAAREVCYYDPEGRKARNIYSNDPERVVPTPYTLSPLLMDAHGGWIASAVDLVRLATRLDLPNGGPVLKPAGIQQLLTPPPAPVSRTPAGDVEAVYYGLGWQVRKVEGGINVWHTGAMPGTSSILVRLANGNTWAAVFNARGDGGAMDRCLHVAAGAVRKWPDHDLFAKYA